MSFWKKLPQPIIGLAPMDGVTDAAYRQITAKHGRPDVSFTEFTPIERIVRGHHPNLTDFRYSGAERPVVAQVFGSSPESFYQVAHVVCELGFDGIDINMGCPAKSIAGKGAGAGLIRTPELALEILRRTREGIRDWAAGQSPEEAGLPALVSESISRNLKIWGIPPVTEEKRENRGRIPVSVKTRLGYSEIVIEDWIEALLSESPAAITVHGRTLKQQYRGESDWDAIARAAAIVRKTDTLILGNGDIRSAATAVRRLRQTGVHGVLLGRATLGNPWIFTACQAIRDAMSKNGPPPAEPSVSVGEKLAVALEHAEIYDFLKGPRPFVPIRKFLAAYCRGFFHASALRRKLVHAKTLSEVGSVIRSFPGQPSPQDHPLEEPAPFSSPHKVLT